MTIFDAMLSILAFLTVPAMFILYGIILIVGALAVWAVGADNYVARWWWVFWVVPSVFLGISLIVWALSSGSPEAWIPR